jgi:hypothetical protein
MPDDQASQQPQEQTMHMVDPKGNVGTAPVSQMDGYFKSGYKYATQDAQGNWKAEQPVAVTRPDGMAGWLPSSKVGDAMKSKYQIGHTPSPSNFDPQANPQDQGPLSGGVNRAWDTIKGMASTLNPVPTDEELKAHPSLAGAAPVLTRLGMGLYQGAKKGVGQTVDQAKAAAAVPPGNPLTKALMYGRAATTGASVLDPLATGSVTNINDLQNQNKPGEALGAGAVDIAGLAAMKGGKSGAQAAQSALKEAALPMTRDAAIQNLKEAVNPIAKDTPAFMSELNTHMDTIANHARQTGAKVTNLDEFAKLAKSTANADPYKDVLVNPLKNEVVNMRTVKGYDGPRLANGDVTIGQLDSRLSEINKTLAPRYVQGPAGSVQQVSAIGAEQTSALRSESAQIRTQLAQEISARTGIDPDVVMKARKNYGELNDMADTARYHADETAHTATAAKNAPFKLNQLGYGNVAESVVNKVRGTRPDRLIDQTFNKYNSYQPAAQPPSIASMLNPPDAPPPRVPTNRPPVSQMSPEQVEQMRSLIQANRERVTGTKLPPVSGGSPAGEGAMGGKAIAEHNAAFNQAKAEWMAKNPGDNPIKGLSAIAQRAEQLRRAKK